MAAFLKVCHQLSAKMYLTGFGGNLAWRLEDKVILITPTMLNKGEIQVEDLVLINPEGETIEGNRRPTGEKFTYLKFFSESPDIKSVIHCHAPNVCAFSILEEDYLMKPYFPEATHEVGPVPIVPYAEPLPGEGMRVRSVLEKRQFLNAAYHREIPFSGQIRVHFQFDKNDILPRPERRVVSKIKTSPKRGSDVSTIRIG